jgi:hypothetical protein
VYSDCLRCNDSLGRNSELTRLPIGRRIAFDGARARVWVVCPSCDQWNLVPIEERWEALEECERLSSGAEARADGGGIGLARTETGLELLRASGISDADIANARYGRRIKKRQELLQATVAALALLAIAVGMRAAWASGSGMVGIIVALYLGYWLFNVWSSPQRGWLRVSTASGRRTTLWPWQWKRLRFAIPNPDKPPVLYVPRLATDLVLRGDEAVEFLAALLPRINGADCVDASIRRAVQDVTEAEAQGRRLQNQTRRKTSRGKRKAERGKRTAERGKRTADPRSFFRPWERLAESCAFHPLTAVPPVRRLALEMAIMEEVEQRELARYAKAVGEAWSDEEEIAAIADDLLTPPQVRERLALLQKARSAANASASDRDSDKA